MASSETVLKPSILVIGGAGYLGSHMVRALQNAQYQPVVFDNLSTGHRALVPEGVPFVKGDLQNPEDVRKVFKEFRLSAAMHFAASSIVPESVREPLKYYRNNTGAFLNLLEEMIARDVRKLIFSSTAAVYGEPVEVPIKEDAVPKPLNPYGQSKWMMEQILADVFSAHRLSYVVFRYFNAAGAHASGDTGERHYPETHLIPNLLAAAAGERRQFMVFGDNYPTRDGTCVRDYVHVEDLCQAHLQALRYLEQGGASDVFNLGSEQGYSVKEVIAAAEQVTGRKIPLKIADRRPGDPATLIADSQKAKRVLGWKANENLETILRSAYEWYQRSSQKKAGEARPELAGLHE